MGRADVGVMALGVLRGVEDEGIWGGERWEGGDGGT